MRIFAVNGQSVLGKVVCSKAEKVAELTQAVAYKGGTGSFYHDSDRNIFFERNIFSRQLLLNIFYKLKALANLTYAGNQREHDF